MAKICIKKQLLSAKWMISYDFTASYMRQPLYILTNNTITTKT